jgi:hypothetical protein
MRCIESDRHGTQPQDVVVVDKDASRLGCRNTVGLRILVQYRELKMLVARMPPPPALQRTEHSAANVKILQQQGHTGQGKSGRRALPRGARWFLGEKALMV